MTKAIHTSSKSFFPPHLHASVYYKSYMTMHFSYLKEAKATELGKFTLVFLLVLRGFIGFW